MDVTIKSPQPFPLGKNDGMNEEEHTYWEDLPGGWRKRSSRRRKESGRWDVTIFTPDNIKIRSRVGLIRYISVTKTSVDPRVVNFAQPFLKGSSIKYQNNEKFIKEVEDVQKAFGVTPRDVDSPRQPTLDERRKSVEISPKQVRYLQRQFKKLSGHLLPVHVEYLSSQLKCPKSQIELCFSLYEDFVELMAKKDPLEIRDTDDAEEFEGFEILKF